MRLPDELVSAIQREIQRTESRDLQRATEELSRQYRTQRIGPPVVKGDTQRAAYLLVRLPATYAATRRVFAETKRLAPQIEVTSLLDLGAGPGTSLFAAADVFPALRQAQLIERSHDWTQLGQRLMANSPGIELPPTEWVEQDLGAYSDFPLYDLVVASYSVGELPETDAQALLRQAWQSGAKLFVVIEPGTPRGFATVHRARSAFIAAGAWILAPCPHRETCPMLGSRDWCHFAQRVERTSLHRRLKGGTLGHEDEKFSYVVAAKTPIAMAAARIVRHPKKLSGHVQLTLCADGGIKTRTIARSSGELYRMARRAEWGDPW